jgi:hypothetical protein
MNRCRCNQQNGGHWYCGKCYKRADKYREATDDLDADSEACHDIRCGDADRVQNTGEMIRPRGEL